MLVATVLLTRGSAVSVRKRRIVTNSTDLPAATPPIAGTSTVPASPSPTVLVVDDNLSFATELGNRLRRHNVRAVVCRDFESAREYLARESPQALVTQLRLGAFNGLHLVLIAKQRAPGIAAFVYSTYDDPVLRADAVGCGAIYMDGSTLDRDDVLARITRGRTEHAQTG
jgi:ActR/RegA family two-component response regulator